MLIDQEPTFQELILLYTKELSESDSKDKAEVPSLQLKIYERIPIPDLAVSTFNIALSVNALSQVILVPRFQGFMHSLSNI